MITLPSLIDCHVHFREPGFPKKATMASESAAAFAGGVHTVCEMPNTNPPTTSIEALRDKVARSKYQDPSTKVDIRFFFGVTAAEHLQELERLFRDDADDLPALRKRCCGVKIYFDHSTGNQGIDLGLLDAVFALCKKLDLTLVAHCEDAEINRSAQEQIFASNFVDPSAVPPVWLHSLVRPAASETKAIADAIALVRKHGTRFHVAHLSTGGGLQLVREAKAEGLPVTCEVTPHHLFLTVEDYESLGTLVKMNPPPRTPAERDALWQGIADGTVDCISTDHAPHTLEEKRTEPPLAAPSGMPSTELMLPLLLTVAAGKWPHPKSQDPSHKIQGLNFDYAMITKLCFTNPNRIFALGKDASEVINVDETAEWTVDQAKLHSLCGWSPYHGWKLTGRVLESAA